MKFNCLGCGTPVKKPAGYCPACLKKLRNPPNTRNTRAKFKRPYG